MGFLALFGSEDAAKWDGYEQVRIHNSAAAPVLAGSHRPGCVSFVITGLVALDLSSHAETDICSFISPHMGLAILGRSSR